MSVRSDITGLERGQGRLHLRMKSRGSSQWNSNAKSNPHSLQGISSELLAPDLMGDSRSLRNQVPWDLPGRSRD